METHARSIAKAISYRFLGSASTALIVYAVTGKLSVSAGAGAADALIKLGLYFVHERIWNHITYGREQEKAPEYEI
jgi:adenylylsulfate kinase